MQRSFGTRTRANKSALSRNASRLVNSVAFSPDGKRVLTGRRDDDGAILWDASTGEQIRVFTGASLIRVTSVAFSPDGKRVLTGSWDHTAILWDATRASKSASSRGIKAR